MDGIMDSWPEFAPAPTSRAVRKSWFREFLETLLPATIAVLVINLFIAQPRTVHGQSMEPHLHENQRVIVEMLSYRFRTPQRGEIVVLNLPDRHSDPLIKRVIGLPGETVEIRSGAVYINGQKLKEPYLIQATTGQMPLILVPEAHVFVMGDNRQQSNDSRYFGPVPLENLIGRAWVSYWPPENAGVFR
jgi:signal peptidase I